MKDLLENIIKTALFEAPTVRAKLKSLSSEDMTIARNKGAAFGYYVVVKGVKSVDRKTVDDAGQVNTTQNLYGSEKAVLNAVAGATMGSQETDKGVGVGGSSTFANGDYVYVAKINDIERKNVVQVWIMPNIYKIVADDEKKKSTAADKSGGVQTTSKVPVQKFTTLIGLSPMVTEKAYNEYVNKVNEIIPDSDLQILQIPDETDGSKKAADVVNTQTTTNQTPAVKTDTPKEITYPTPANFLPNGRLVYTTGPKDPYVYVYDTEKWLYTDKKSFEMRLNDPRATLNPWQIVKGGTDKLNALRSGKDINQQQDQSNQNNQTQDQGNQTQDQGNKKQEKKVGSTVTLKTGTVPLYYWKDNKMVSAGTVPISAPSKKGANDVKIAGIKTYNNNKYYYVQIGGKGYWVGATRFE